MRRSIYFGPAAKRPFRYPLHQNRRAGRPDAIIRYAEKGNIHLELIGDTFPLNLHYAYGIRNGFGMDFDPIMGILWDTEPGHLINDEIDMVRPGFNSRYGIVQGVCMSQLPHLLL